jgi:hypothetical protein
MRLGKEREAQSRIVNAGNNKRQTCPTTAGSSGTSQRGVRGGSQGLRRQPPGTSFRRRYMRLLAKARPDLALGFVGSRRRASE